MAGQHGGAGSAAQHGMTVGKLLGIAGTAAVVGVSAVLVYNSLIKKPAQNASLNKIEKKEITANNPVENPNKSVSQNIGATKPIVKIQEQAIIKNLEGSKNLRGDVGVNAGKETFSSQNSLAQTDNSNYNSTIQSGLSSNNSGIVKQPLDHLDNALSNLLISDAVICSGKALSFEVPSNTGTLQVNWGDGSVQPAGQLASHTYMTPGTYQIKIKCGTGELNRQVEVAAMPKARFFAYNDERLVCKFHNLSEGSQDYLWNFGDGSQPEKAYHAEHQYHDSGKYLVKMVAYNSAGCSDTFVQPVYIRQNSGLEVANVITPNGDGINDDLEIRLENEESFELHILDNRGNTIFQTNDKNLRWKGTYLSGEPCQNGVYFYVIKYKYKNEAGPREEHGMVHLYR
jgi:gliding motility-associated-like protein